MANIRKRPNGTFQATIYIGRDALGKNICEYITCPTKKECVQAVRKREQELEDKKFLRVEKVRVVSWIDEWIELNRGRLSPSTIVLYKIYSKNHYTPYFGDIQLGKLNEIHIRRFMAEKLQTLSPTTVRKLILVLNKILRDALKERNPAKDIEVPSDEEFDPYVLTDEEFGIIREAVRGTRDEPIVLLAALCGLRRGEIFALKWNDIEWKNGTLRIDESRCITDDGAYIDKKPKSKNGYRRIIVPAEILSILDELRKEQIKKAGKKKRRRRAKEETNDPSLENVTEIKQQIWDMRPDSYSSYWAAFVREKGLPPIRFHDLRHYHASVLYDLGIPDQYVAKRLGHDIKTLKKIYQHVRPDTEKELDESIRQLYDKKENDLADCESDKP